MEQTKQPAKGSGLKAIISIIVLVFLIYFFFGGGVEKQAAKEMAKAENQVAEDAIKQYNIAKTGGDKIEIYSHASYVVAAFLQAKDSVNYLKWKAIERKDAKAAGLEIK